MSVAQLNPSGKLNISPPIYLDRCVIASRPSFFRFSVNVNSCLILFIRYTTLQTFHSSVGTPFSTVTRTKILKPISCFVSSSSSIHHMYHLHLLHHRHHRHHHHHHHPSTSSSGSCMVDLLSGVALFPLLWVTDLDLNSNNFFRVSFQISFVSIQFCANIKM